MVMKSNATSRAELHSIAEGKVFSNSFLTFSPFFNFTASIELYVVFREQKQEYQSMVCQKKVMITTIATSFLHSCMEANAFSSPFNRLQGLSLFVRFSSPFPSPFFFLLKRGEKAEENETKLSSAMESRKLLK